MGCMRSATWHYGWLMAGLWLAIYTRKPRKMSVPSALEIRKEELEKILEQLQQKK